ncbi:zinc finger and BTB domain-containing protein 24-like [Culicoides brevitarsis]|uniref:zinc finger and BTB domain-containing protein 24-like n=1 Tax=Culicoides brevitarsis TaxID=469753 RepID=UPI00307BB0E7
MDALQNYKARLYCETCDIKFGNRKDLATHNNIVHSCKPFECSVCHKKFSERFTLKVHFRIHTGERPHVCLYCNKSFSQACNLTTHKKRYHFKKLANTIKSRQQLDAKAIHKCPHCTIMFRRIEHVKAHILSTHVNRASSSTNGGARSPSTSSGVSSSSESQSVTVKREFAPAEGRILLHCKECRLSFPDRTAFEKHRQAHRDMGAVKKPQNSILVSNSNGQKVSLSELVSQIKQKTEAMSVKQEPKDVIQKLSGLGMEISLHPLKREAPNDLGLVISNVQSVSQQFFDELETRKPMMRSRPGPRCSKIGALSTVKQEKVTPTRRSNGMRTIYKPEIPQISPNMTMRDPLELPTTLQTPPMKQPEEIKTEQEVVLSSTRRSNRSFVYKEADQPKHISIITKYKNGKTTKRRIFPCGQCTSKFENIETRKMHFMAVHNSNSSNSSGGGGSTARKSTASPANISKPPPIIPQIIAAYEHE